MARVERGWPKIWEVLEPYFEVTKDEVAHERLINNLTFASARSKVNSRNGKRGGEAKALKAKERGVANATMSPDVSPEDRCGENLANYNYNCIETFSDENVSLTSPPETPPDGPPIEEAVEVFKDAAGRCGWPVPREMSKARRSHLTARLKDGGLDGWREMLGKAEASDFLCGRTSKPFFASFDWLVNASNFNKVMEGNYDNKQSAAGGGGSPASSQANRVVDALNRMDDASQGNSGIVGGVLLGGPPGEP